MPFPLPADKIAWTEAALGVRFPLDYLARLKRDNGGELAIGEDVWQLFPFRDDTDRKRIARTCNHVAAETRSFREWSRFPAGAVAIATDGASNALVLLPRDDDASALGDAVFDWFHETGELTRVADAFSEL